MDSTDPLPSDVADESDVATEPDVASGSPARSLGTRVGWALLRWLPLPVIATVLVASLVAMADLAPPPRPSTNAASDTALTPLLDIRRLPELFRDPIEDRRRAELAEELEFFLLGQPVDTCLVVTDDTDVVLDHRGDDPQVPASAHKILTGVAALLALGADHRYETVVAALEPPVDGVVGDLYLVGGGDPILATSAYIARFRSQPQVFSDIGALADAVVDAGVVRVDGAIVGDESRYDQVRYNPLWPPRFITQNQTGPLSALSVNDGFASFPAEGAAPVQPAEDPARHAADVFRSELTARGVAVLGGVRSGVAPPERVAIASHRSPPMVDVVAQMLSTSDNNTAELLLKEIGVAVTGMGTFDSGRVGVSEILRNAGFGLDGVGFADGSGLAEENRASCNFLMELLEFDPTEEAVIDGLAVAGESGTLRTRWTGSDLVGRVRAKTGTLNQVTALVGVADALDGRRHRFALVVNIEEPAIIQRETVAAQESLAAILVGHEGVVDLAPYGLPGSSDS